MEGGESVKGGKVSSKDTSKFSRRDFLKLAGVAGGIGAAYLGKRTWERVTGVPEGREKEDIYLSINMADFVTPVESGEKDTFSIDFKRLKKNYPFLVDDREGSWVLKNRQEKKVELSFDDLGGKTIVFREPNEIEAAKSNIDPKEYQGEKGYGKVKAGLVLEGNFSVSFDRMFTDKPKFVGTGLDRGIYFKGVEKNAVCQVENIHFEGLNDYTQAAGGQEIPAPAYISADNAALFVQGVDISHTPQKPENIDEVNSQLTRGIILNVTGSKGSLEENHLEVKGANIKGLLWDAIVSNGEVAIKVEDSRLEQSEKYRLRRGAGVATTFNTNRGSITVIKSRVDYNKGVANFTNAESPSAFVNILIEDSILSVSQWATVLKFTENATIKSTVIDLTKGASERIAEGQELTSWDQAPLGHITIESTLEDTKKLMENVSFTFSDTTPDNDKVLLLRIYGGKRAFDDPDGYIEKAFSGLGSIGILDRRQDGLRRLHRWFTEKNLKAVLKRAISEKGHYPTEVVFVYKKSPTVFDEWGVIVDDLSEGVVRRKPSKVFWYQPLEEERGYQENPKYY